MKTQFDIEEVLSSGELANELEYERALIAERRLRLLAKENVRIKVIRNKLRDIIERYEDKNWSEGSEIDQFRLSQSDLAELIAEKERQFLQRRKKLIKERLKKYSLTQEQLMFLLGHRSKTYMSELINGLSPFTLNDIVIIHRLLKIKLTDLVPTTIPYEQRIRINKSIQDLGKEISLGAEDFDLLA